MFYCARIKSLMETRHFLVDVPQYKTNTKYEIHSQLKIVALKNVT